MKVNTDGVLLGAAMSIPQDATLMLDIGTGTGTIALMAAQRHPGAAIHAIDIDEASAREAAENFAASPWADRLSASRTALADFRPSRKYSHIFSNPPYYDNSLMNPDAREGEARHSVSLSYRDILAFAAEIAGAGRPVPHPPRRHGKNAPARLRRLGPLPLPAPAYPHHPYQETVPPHRRVFPYQGSCKGRTPHHTGIRDLYPRV